MRVAVFEKRWVEVRKAARDRISQCQRENLCVACLQPIGQDEPIRGCHGRCYHATYRAIRAGKTTDAERVAAGKLLEPQDPGRKPSNPVSLDVG